jgi:hypothetical protein
VIDSEAGTQTYYANSANASHSNTGTINYYDIIFKSNVNKAEINGGGVQIVSNETAFVKMMRIDPGSYSFGSMLMQTRGGYIDVNAGGATLADSWGAYGIQTFGGQYMTGRLGIGYGSGTVTAWQEVFKIDGPSTGVLANQWYATVSANINPYSDDTWDLGGTSRRWRDIFTNGAVTTTSDRTKKTNITPSALGLDFINKLNPVSYTMITGSKVWEELPPTISVLEEEAKYDGDILIKEATYKEVPNPEKPEVIEIIPGKRTHYGLIAQDVKTTLDEIGLTTNDFAGYVAGDVETDTDLGLRYEEFISPIVKAIQELSEKVNRLEAHISGSL